MAFDDLDRAEQAESAEETEDPADSEGSDATDATDATDSTGADASATDPPAIDSDSPTGSRPLEGRGRSRDADEETEADAAHSEPAFGFEEAKQRPLYARQRSWDAFEDALAIDVEPTLRRHAVRDASKRELHDAALRVLADHAEEVADRVLEARGIDSDVDRDGRS